MDRREFLIKSAAFGCATALGQGLLWGNKIYAGGHGLHPARWQEKLPDGEVRCVLCPLNEVLKPGQMGACRVRENQQGRLVVTNHGKPAAMHLDPVEKNPLYHYTPGVQCLALATAGCNLACPACQNWEISQRKTSQVRTYDLTPEKAVFYAERNNCGAVSYTFSEPVVFAEYMLDTARLARKRGMKNHVVTGGFVNPDPLREICSDVDSMVVSIKGLDDSEYGRAGAFDTIKEVLKIIADSDCWLEIAVLVVPTRNDDISQLSTICRWIADNLGPNVPVHFSRFYPSFRLRNLPQTPVASLERARRTALDCGIKYAYVGNVPGHIHNNTYCHNCQEMLIQRVGFRVIKNNLAGSSCPKCKTRIPGIWHQS